MTNSRSLLESLTKSWPAKVLSLAAAVLLFLFNRMESLEQTHVSVPLELRGLGDLLPGQEYPRLVKLTLRGDRAALSFISPADLEAWVDLSKVTGEGRRGFPVVVTRRGAALEADPLEIKVNPSQVTLSLERRETRELPVEALFRGYSDAGFEMVYHRMTPASVLVTGPRGLVSTLERIGTLPIDLAGLRSDATVRIGLSLPSPLVAFAGSSEVDVSIGIRAAQAQRTLDGVPIVIRGLRPGLAVAGEAPLGSLTLRGAATVLESLGSGAGILSLDLAEVMSPGVFSLPVYAEAPEDLEIVGWEPPSVTLSFVPEAAR